MSLEAERRVDKDKGKVGIIKKVCESKSNPASLTSSFLKATFEGGFSSWTCHTQEKRPALMITRYLLLSFFAKPLSFSQDSSITMSALYAIFVYGKAFQLFIRYSTSVTPVIHDPFFSIIAIEDDEISNQCQASHLRSLLQYI